MTQTTTTDPNRIEPWNEVTDRAKLDQLIDSMDRSGWTGAPIVVIEVDRYDIDALAVTGSHRIAAARTVGIDVPTVDLADLLAEHGADLNALIGEYEEAGLDTEDARYEVVCRLDQHLPAEVADYYGLDAH